VDFVPRPPQQRCQLLPDPATIARPMYKNEGIHEIFAPLSKR
jgi:hypothetical protein